MATTNPYSPFPAFSGRNTPQMLPQPNQPRPLYFLSRNNGLLVPLIPADELPFNVRLQGVPRVMQFDQTYGMQHVGTAPYTGMTFKLESETAMQRSNSQPPAATHIRNQSTIDVNPFKQYLAPDALARQAMAQSASNQAAAAPAMAQRPTSAHETATSWRSNIPSPAPTSNLTSNPIDKTQSIIDAIVSSTAGAAEAARIGYVPKPTSTPPSGYLPDQDKKEFCTYWIRTGECDYTQQGCLYKHEMPDRATLEKIGFRTMPRWWAEKQSAVRIGSGGEKASVGPIVKSSEWLKKKPKEAAAGEDDDDSGSSGSESEVSSSSAKSMTSKKVVDVVMKPATPEPVRKAEVIKQVASEPTKSDHARAQPPPSIDIRKASVASDLIDFAIPLLPTPSSSTPSLTPASSTESSPRTGQSTPLTPPTPPSIENVTTSIKPTASATKVFVPKGESPDLHIAEAKKRAARQHVRRGAPVSTLPPAKPLERQIQEMQKAKHQQGLMASKHAPTAITGAAAGNDEQQVQKHEPRNSKNTEQAARRGTKTGCRIRRPATSSAPAPGQKAGAPVAILRREGGAEK